MDSAPEILINASKLIHHDYGDTYEFVLDLTLTVVECVKVESLLKGRVTPICNPEKTLKNDLFEINHVRVNPNLDNTKIIKILTEALNNIGVEVNNLPDNQSISMSFKPLGEISDNVRFHIGPHSQMIFMSSSMRPKLVTTRPSP